MTAEARVQELGLVDFSFELSCWASAEELRGHLFLLYMGWSEVLGV